MSGIPEGGDNSKMPSMEIGNDVFSHAVKAGGEILSKIPLPFVRGGGGHAEKGHKAGGQGPKKGKH